MNHRKAFRKLGRTPAHRRALFRNLATSLVLHNQIETTLPKAKELKRIADKLITLGKKNSLHARRQAMAYLNTVNRHAEGKALKWTAVHRLFTELAPQYSERHGGYTRVLRTRKRPGDKAQMALIQFVEAKVQKTDKRRKRRVVKSSAKSVESKQGSPEGSTAEGSQEANQ